jgi:hypothetical protein
MVLGLLSTGRWARGTAARAAALFEGVDTGGVAGARHRPGDRTGQESRSAGHRAATSVAVMDTSVHSS